MRGEVQVVRGAVHGLERHVVLARLAVEHQEHVLLVLPPVPRLLPQLLVVQQRRLDLLERLALPLADEPLQRVVQRGALGSPEHAAGGHREQLEQLERLAQHAVVALARLLQPVEVLLELVLAEVGRGVDALQHLPLLVAAPVGAGDGEQLEVLEPRRVLDVRPPAQVHEGAVGVGGDDLVAPLEVVQPLQLERIVGEADACLRQRHLLALEGELLRHHLPHLGLERLEILGGERALHLEIVVEPLLDGGAEADLGLGAQAAHGRGEDVRPGVAQHGEGARILVGDDHEGPRRPQGGDQVLHLAIHRHRHGGLQQPGADGAHDVAREGPDGDLAGRAVGEGEHERRLVGRAGSGGGAGSHRGSTRGGATGVAPGAGHRPTPQASRSPRGPPRARGRGAAHPLAARPGGISFPP